MEAKEGDHMPSNSKLGSGLDAIFGSDINSLLDDIQNGNEPSGVTTSNTFSNELFPIKY